MEQRLNDLDYVLWRLTHVCVTLDGRWAASLPLRTPNNDYIVLRSGKYGGRNSSMTLGLFFIAGDNLRCVVTPGVVHDEHGGPVADPGHHT